VGFKKLSNLVDIAGMQTVPSPHSNHTVIEDELLARIHPALREQVTVISIDHLDPHETQLVFADNSATVLRELVRDMREKQRLP
jgi:hypothetical protein